MTHGKYRLRLLIFLLVAGLGTTIVGVQYVGLDRYLWNRPIQVRALTAEAGGIFPNAEVTYRGVAVGRVDAVELDGNGRVEIIMALEPDSDVPRDARAVVENRSAIGEQFVDLQPDSDGGPFLVDGDVIGEEHTSIPTGIDEVLLNVQELVESVDKAALRTLVSEVGAGLGGLGPELRAIVLNSDALVRDLRVALPDTRELLTNGQTVLDTQRDTSRALESWTRDLDLLTKDLAANDESIRAVITETARTAPRLIDLVADNDQQLPLLMRDILTFGELVRARLDGVRVFLVAFPRLIQDTFNVVQGDGFVHFNVALDYSSGVCTSEGYASTEKSVQAEPVKELGNPDKRANLNAYCAEPEGSSTAVRGSQNVPKLPGDTYDPTTQKVDNPRLGRLGPDNVPERSYEDVRSDVPSGSAGSAVMNRSSGVVSTSFGPLLVLGDVDAPTSSAGTWKDLLMRGLVPGRFP